jgi:hypothetical protein
MATARQTAAGPVDATGAGLAEAHGDRPAQRWLAVGSSDDTDSRRARIAAATAALTGPTPSC